LCQTPIDLFVIGKTFLIWPLFPVRGQTQREPDSLECSSTFRGLIQTFEEDGQSRPLAIAIFRAPYTIR